MAELSHAADIVDDAERRWTYVVVVVVVFVLAMIVLAGVHWGAQPPSNVETIDASRLHLSGEFMDGNLGTEIRPDGSAVVRVLAQQYSFVPGCIVVPAQTRVVFRATSPDVVHGFLVAGTNVNTMVVPGFVAEVRAQFGRPGEHVMPCHEYCSVGHEGMWARVKVLDREEYARAYAGQSRASCVRK